MKMYKVHRLKDDSGVSGTGIVAECAEFSNGKAVVSWLGVNNGFVSTAVYDSIKDVEAIHGHNGHTVLVFVGESI